MASLDEPAEWLKVRVVQTLADGRHQRASKSRNQIIQAALDLVREGNATPNAAEVADRAQLGLRSVFRHFKDMESLFYGMLEEVQELIMPIATRPVTGDTFAERLDCLIEIRYAVFERVNPYQDSVDFYLKTSPLFQQRRTMEAQFLRLQLVSLLSEFENVDPATIEAIDLILCFVAWRRMKNIQGLSTPQIKNIVTQAVLKLVS
jgi:AcrR family transcriptional regulator